MKKAAKTILIVLGFLILVIGIPIGINECYKANLGYVTVWKGSDVLSYYGTLLGAIVAIFTLIQTIRFTRKQIKRESYLKVEKKKWDKIRQVVADAIEKNNPIRVFQLTIDLGNGDIQRCVFDMQKFSVEAKISIDNIKCYINPDEYKKVEALVTDLILLQNDLLKVTDELIKQYQDLAMLYTHNDPSWQQKLDEAAAIRARLISLHDNQYQYILNSLRECLDKVDSELQQKADSLLRYF